MPFNDARIEHLVVLTLENRSVDHLVGVSGIPDNMQRASTFWKRVRLRSPPVTGCCSPGIAGMLVCASPTANWSLSRPWTPKVVDVWLDTVEHRIAWATLLLIAGPHSVHQFRDSFGVVANMFGCNRQLRVIRDDRLPCARQGLSFRPLDVHLDEVDSREL